VQTANKRKKDPMIGFRSRKSSDHPVSNEIPSTIAPTEAELRFSSALASLVFNRNSVDLRRFSFSLYFSS